MRMGASGIVSCREAASWEKQWTMESFFFNGFDLIPLSTRLVHSRFHGTRVYFCTPIVDQRTDESWPVHFSLRIHAARCCSCSFVLVHHAGRFGYSYMHCEAMDTPSDPTRLPKQPHKHSSHSTLDFHQDTDGPQTSP